MYSYKSVVYHFFLYSYLSIYFSKLYMYYIDDVLKSISTLDHSNLHYIIMLHFCCSHSFFFTFVSRFPLLSFSLFLNLLLHFENTQTLKKRYRYIIVFKTHWVTLYHSKYKQLIS